VHLADVRFHLVLAYFIGSNLPLGYSNLATLKSWVPFKFDSPRSGRGYEPAPFATAAAENKRARFLEVFSDVRAELIGAFAAQGVPEDAQAWYTRVSLHPLLNLRTGTGFIFFLTHTGRTSTTTSPAGS
jgi:hypothetical protein